MRSRNGFTLMELMIVIAIIMILSAAIVARITTGTEKAKYAKANGEMAEIAAAIKAFYLDVGYWPYYGSWDSPAGDKGLISKDSITHLLNDAGSGVVITDSMKANWKGPYLEAMEWPKDPWGRWNYNIYLHIGSSRVLYVLSAGPNFNYDTTADALNTGKPSGDDVVLLVHRF